MEVSNGTCCFYCQCGLRFLVRIVPEFGRESKVTSAFSIWLADYTLRLMEVSHRSQPFECGSGLGLISCSSSSEIDLDDWPKLILWEVFVEWLDSECCFLPCFTLILSLSVSLQPQEGIKLRASAKHCSFFHDTLVKASYLTILSEHSQIGHRKPAGIQDPIHRLMFYLLL